MLTLFELFAIDCLYENHTTDSRNYFPNNDVTITVNDELVTEIIMVCHTEGYYVVGDSEIDFNPKQFNQFVKSA